MTGTAPLTTAQAHKAFVDHPYFPYRGCAPDPDNPRQAAGNPALTVDAWHGEDRDGAEPPQERKDRVAAAIDVCMGCAVWAQCDAYSNSVTPEGKLAEPDGIRAGRTALERHRALIKSRQNVVVEPAPDHELRTEQKLAVLRALAVHELPEDVARAAGLDARTAAWQRARITTQLGLEKTASRAEVLEAAVARGLLRAEEVAARAPTPAVVVPGGRRGARGRRVASVPGQLSFFEAGPAMGAAA